MFCSFISTATDETDGRKDDDPIALNKVGGTEYLTENEDKLGDLKGLSITTAQPDENEPKHSKKISISCFFEDGDLKAVDL